MGEDDEALAGATIGLFSAFETEFTEETALMTIVSDEEGAFRFDKVPVGNWIVREIAQPEGYVLCEELFPVSISENEQVQMPEPTLGQWLSAMMGCSARSLAGVRAMCSRVSILLSLLHRPMIRRPLPQQSLSAKALSQLKASHRKKQRVPAMSPARTMCRTVLAASLSSISSSLVAV